MQKILNLGLCVPDAQGSRKHEGEWPNKPGSQYQAWHFKISRRHNGSIRIYVSIETIMEPLTFFGDHYYYYYYYYYYNHHHYYYYYYHYYYYYYWYCYCYCYYYYYYYYFLLPLEPLLL